MDSVHYRSPNSPDCHYKVACGEISYEIPYADSFRSRVLFAGRNVATKGGDFWEKAHLIARQPFGLVGAALGAGAGYVGGAVYKAGRQALGRAEQTRPLSDYAVKAANKTRRATCKLVGVVLTPAAYTLLLGLSAAGVAGAGLGATTTVVGTSVYNMVKRHKGEYAQIKSISDYVINGALIGSYVAMFAAASAALFPGGKYVESRPDWF